MNEIAKKISTKLESDPSANYADFSKAVDAVKVDYNNDDNYKDESVFTSSEPLDRGDLCDALAKVTKNDPNNKDFKKYSDIIFDLYDENNDDKLSATELGYLNDSDNKTKEIKIDNWSVYNSFGTFDSEEVAAEMNKGEVDDSDGDELTGDSEPEQKFTDFQIKVIALSMKNNNNFNATYANMTDADKERVDDMINTLGDENLTEQTYTSEEVKDMMNLYGMVAEEDQDTLMQLL